MPPGGTAAPFGGSWAITVPGGFGVLLLGRLRPSGRPPGASASRPRRCCRPRRARSTPSWPLETVSVIVRPLVACLPASGETEITSPSGTVSENAFLTEVLKPSASSACSASSLRVADDVGHRHRALAAGDLHGHGVALAHLRARLRVLRDHLVARDLVVLDVDVGDLEAALVQRCRRRRWRCARRGSAPSPSRPRAGSTRRRPPRPARAATSAHTHQRERRGASDPRLARGRLHHDLARRLAAAPARAPR